MNLFPDANDQLDDRVNGFFMNAKRMKPSERETEFESVRKDYYKVLEDAGKYTKSIFSEFVRITDFLNFGFFKCMALVGCCR